MNIVDFIREDGSAKIPKEFVPFLELKVPEKKTCENCGLEFYPTHQRQRFCPVEPGKKRSKCENTYNQRVKRQRRKELKEK